MSISLIQVVRGTVQSYSKVLWSKTPFILYNEFTWPKADQWILIYQVTWQYAANGCTDNSDLLPKRINTPYLKSTGFLPLLHVQRLFFVSLGVIGFNCTLICLVIKPFYLSTDFLYSDVCTNICEVDGVISAYTTHQAVGKKITKPEACTNNTDPLAIIDDFHAAGLIVVWLNPRVHLIALGVSGWTGNVRIFPCNRVFFTVLLIMCLWLYYLRTGRSY